MVISKMPSIKMNLANVLYVSYLVPSVRIRPLVPPFLSLSTDDADQVYISFVAMKCRRVRLSIIPWPRFNYDQLNLRTYVTDPKTGNPAVYFFQSGVSLGVVPMLTRIMGIPWEKIVFEMDSTFQPAHTASGYWLGDLSFKVESPVGELPQDSIIEHLTGPMMGFMGPVGKTRSFRINHRALKVQPAILRSIEFPLPIEKRLINETELNNPANILMVPEAEFTVYLPPRGVS